MSGNNFKGIGQKPLTGAAPQYKNEVARLAVGPNADKTKSAPIVQGRPISSRVTADNVQDRPDNIVNDALAAEQEQLSPMEKTKLKLREAAQLGGMSYVQAIAEVDPETAEKMKTRLIQQKTELMMGYQDTAAMTDQEFLAYQKKTKNLADLAFQVQSATPEDRPIVYQQLLPKIKDIVPNAPKTYDPSYVSIASIEGNPIKKAASENETLAKLMEAPLNKAQLEKINPALAKAIPGDSAKEIMGNQDGSYKVYESLDKDGNKQFTVNNNGKVYKLEDKMQIVPGMKQEVVDAAMARRKAMAGGMSPTTAALVANMKNAKSPEEKAAATAIFQQHVQSEATEKQRQLDHARDMEKAKFVADVKASVNADGTLSKATKTMLEKDYINQSRTLNQMDRVQASLKDEDIEKFLTAQGKVGTWTAEALDKIGLGNIKIPGQDKSARGIIETAQVINTSMGLLFDQYRKEITGAAAAVQELDQLKARIANGETMTPQQFRTSFNEILKRAQEELAANRNIIREGRLPDVYARDPQPFNNPTVPVNNYEDLTDEEIDAELARRAQEGQ